MYIQPTEYTQFLYYYNEAPAAPQPAPSNEYTQFLYYYNTPAAPLTAFDFMNKDLDDLVDFYGFDYPNDGDCEDSSNASNTFTTVDELDEELERYMNTSHEDQLLECLLSIPEVDAMQALMDMDLEVAVRYFSCKQQELDAELYDYFGLLQVNC